MTAPDASPADFDDGADTFDTLYEKAGVELHNPNGGVGGNSMDTMAVDCCERSDHHTPVSEVGISGENGNDMSGSVQRYALLTALGSRWRPLPKVSDSDALARAPAAEAAVEPFAAVAAAPLADGARASEHPAGAAARLRRHIFLDPEVCLRGF